MAEAGREATQARDREPSRTSGVDLTAIHGQMKWPKLFLQLLNYWYCGVLIITIGEGPLLLNRMDPALSVETRSVMSQEASKTLKTLWSGEMDCG